MRQTITIPLSEEELQILSKLTAARIQRTPHKNWSMRQEAEKRLLSALRQANDQLDEQTAT